MVDEIVDAGAIALAKCSIATADGEGGRRDPGRSVENSRVAGAVDARRIALRVHTKTDNFVCGVKAMNIKEMDQELPKERSVASSSAAFMAGRLITSFDKGLFE